MSTAPRILVVDDEPIVVKSCDRVLRCEGFSVESAPTARQGLELANRNGFELVLLDLVLPDMNGIDVLRQIRKQKPETSVVMITGYPSVDTAVAAMKLGAVDYLIKPFTAEGILNAVAKALRNGQRRTEPSPSAVGLEQRPLGLGVCRSIRLTTEHGILVSIVGQDGTFGPASPVVLRVLELLKGACGSVTLEYGMREVNDADVDHYLESNDRVVLVRRQDGSDSASFREATAYQPERRHQGAAELTVIDIGSSGQMEPSVSPRDLAENIAAAAVRPMVTGTATPPDEAPRLDVAPVDRGANQTILVVDYDADIRSATALILRHHGYGVRTAASGSEGERVLGEMAHDIPLVVLGGSTEDGARARFRRTCQALKKRNPRVRILALACGTAEICGQKARQAGADAYLQKPCGHGELLAAVRQLLRKRGAPAAAIQ